jgi:hypothetical protein
LAEATDRNEDTDVILDLFTSNVETWEKQRLSNGDRHDSTKHELDDDGFDDVAAFERLHI